MRVGIIVGNFPAAVPEAEAGFASVCTNGFDRTNGLIH